ncbi:MAG TPA: metal-dependent hydrolase [Gallionellaceae bacterium]|nr:metal-dependent hydrolase [Gallionellaceae bacterium]
MPTILTHAAVPLAIGLGLGSSAIPGRLLIAGVIASIVPDIDVVSFRLGIAYADTFGHRGFSHSILFALLLAAFAISLSSRFGVSRKTSFGFVFVATMSHGVLDMFTNGGLGVALLAPLSDQRYFMPWQVIQVSPLSLHRIMSGRGMEVIWSELQWVWLPSALLSMSLLYWRLKRRPARVQFN